MPPPSRPPISCPGSRSWSRPPSRRRCGAVINATGVVAHTNLGRSLLPPEALAAVAAVAGSYTDLEIDLDDGRARQPAAPRARRAVRPDRRRRRPGGQQQRRRRAARAGGHLPRRRGDRLARRARRDRRRLSHSRHPRRKRRPAGRGRHHEPHLPARRRSAPGASARGPCCACTRATTGSWASPRSRPSTSS